MWLFGAMPLVLAAGALAAFLAYVGYVQSTLDRFPPESRPMAPGLSWLMVVPVFGAAWQFRVSLAVSRSFGQEFRTRGTPGAHASLRGLGLAKSTVDALALAFFLVAVVTAVASPGLFDESARQTAAVGVFTSALLGCLAVLPASLGLWVAYWTKIGTVTRAVQRVMMEEMARRSWPSEWQPWPAAEPGVHPCPDCGRMLSAERFCGWCGAPQ